MKKTNSTKNKERYHGDPNRKLHFRKEVYYNDKMYYYLEHKSISEWLNQIQNQFDHINMVSKDRIINKGILFFNEVTEKKSETYVDLKKVNQLFYGKVTFQDTQAVKRLQNTLEGKIKVITKKPNNLIFLKIIRNKFQQTKDKNYILYTFIWL